MSNYTKILYSGFLVFVITVIVKLLAFLKEIIVASKFGMNELTDAYNVAFLLPNVLIYLVGVTILTGIPSSLFSESIARNNQKELSQTFSTIFNLIFVSTVTISFLCFWQMPAIINLYAGDFQEETIGLAVWMGRILITILISMGIANYLSSTLYAFRNYVLPGLSQVIAYICVIVCLIVLSERFSIKSLAIGTALGFFLSFALLLVYIVRTKIKYVFSFNILSPTVKKFIIIAAPLILLDITNQICILIDRKVALGMFDGAFSALVYSLRIYEIAPNLFVIPFMTVLLPEFARDTALKNMDALKSRIRFGAEVLAAIIVFWIAFLLIFHREVVTVFYYRGEFTQGDVIITSKLLLINTIGLVFHAGYLFLLFIYLGLQKTRSLAAIGVIAYVINIVFIFILTPLYGIYGLAMASAIMAFVYCVLLFITFKRRYIQFQFMNNITNLSKIFGLGLIVVMVYLLLYPVIIGSGAVSNLLLMMRLGISFAAGLIFYAGMLKILNVFSFKSIFEGITRYIRG